MKTKEQQAEEKYPYLPTGSNFTVENTHDDLMSIKRQSFIAGYEAAQKWIPATIYPFKKNDTKSDDVFVTDGKNYTVGYFNSLLKTWIAIVITTLLSLTGYQSQNYQQYESKFIN